MILQLNKRGYLYRHIRNDINQVFYVGVGGFNRTEKPYKYNRAFEKIGRNNLCNKITSKTTYEVEIVLQDLTLEQVLLK
jgi:hypothetical protein